jgi:hypothetical protein
MAYFDQTKKKAIEPAIKALCKEYGVKATLGVKHSSSVVLNVLAGAIDFACEYEQVNVYWVEKNFSGKAQEFLLKALAILNTGNYNNSDSQSDYFDVGHYVDINIGKWDKPYELVK